jgi:hypothetical protein
MAQYFRWNGAIIGKDCCLYLVVIADRCIVDYSSIVCHLNTRGNFELATITMENVFGSRRKYNKCLGYRLPGLTNLE